jgi:hypothetical protein
MHHAEADWADGGLTDATDMAPACGRHNRAVGSEPHQWSTEKITEGPDRGRYGWRRNTDPPEKLRANHLHRIDELLQQHSTSSDPWVELPDIEGPSPQVIDVEHQRAPRIDITWPDAPLYPAA